MSRTNYNDIRAALPVSEYQYDPVRNAWYHNKEEIGRLDVKKALVTYIRAKVAKAGDWADRAIEIIKQDPAYTLKSFLRAGIRKERGRRVKGIDAFCHWMKLIGLDITNTRVNPAEFMRKHNRLVGRFYDALAEAGYKIARRARIRGLQGSFANVIDGIVITDIKPEEKHHIDLFVNEDPEITRRKANVKKWESFLDNLLGDERHRWSTT